jgi:hypothetical protein
MHDLAPSAVPPRPQEFREAFDAPPLQDDDIPF